MTDTLNQAERSSRMARIKSKNTKPELIVRRLLHNLRYRYRLHVKEIPGKPDIVFKSRKKVIFVHGCFWHRHLSPDCKLVRFPKSRKDFWQAKFSANVKRDAANLEQLAQENWRVMVVWECELRNIEQVENRLVGFLED